MKMERLLGIGSWLLVISGFLEFIGLSWDVQWHADVGPDTFFTIPHTLIYSSAALDGLVSLFVGIAFTDYIRIHPETTIEYRSLAGLKGPVGYILCGISSVIFICSGFYDLWWHTVYGFDVTLVSPSHFGLFFSSMIGRLGLLYIFASASERAKLQNASRRLFWNHLGFAISVATLCLSLAPFLMISLSQLRMIGSFIGYPVFATVIFTSGLFGVAAYTKRFGMVTCSALFLSVVKLVSYTTTPGLVAWLASHEDLIYKYNATRFPLISTSLPLWILAMGLFIEIWLYAMRKLRIGSLSILSAGGGIAAVLLYILDPRWKVFAGGRSGAVKPAVLASFHDGYWPTFALVAILGAIFAVIGSKVGETFIYANMNCNKPTLDLRKSAKGTIITLILISLGATIVMPVSASAHEAAPDKDLVQIGKLKAGPYDLTVFANEYPIKAKKSLQIRVAPEGGIDGLKGTYNLSLPGSNRKALKGSLNPYPGVKDAWVFDLSGIPAQGEWVLKLAVQGPKGSGTGTLGLFEVLPPPGIPMWVGWVIGLFPLYLLIAFFISEMRRIRKLKEKFRENQSGRNRDETLA